MSLEGVLTVKELIELLEKLPDQDAYVTLADAHSRENFLCRSVEHGYFIDAIRNNNRGKTYPSSWNASACQLSDQVYEFLKENNPAVVLKYVRK